MQTFDMLENSVFMRYYFFSPSVFPAFTDCIPLLYRASKGGKDTQAACRHRAPTETDNDFITSSVCFFSSFQSVSVVLSSNALTDEAGPSSLSLLQALCFSILVHFFNPSLPLSNGFRLIEPQTKGRILLLIFRDTRLRSSLKPLYREPLTVLIIIMQHR